MGNNGNLIIHFLNVGHGDCTIIEHPSGRITVIDINNGQQLDKDSYKEIKNVLTPSQGLMAAVGYLPEPQSVSQLLGLGLEEQYYYDVQDAKRMGYAVSLTDPIQYLNVLCMVRGKPKEIWRYIQTHPDMDHMRGLTALDNEFSILNFWDTKTTKETPNFNKVFHGDKSDWNTYKRFGKEKSNVFNLVRGNTGSYWSSGDGHLDNGDGIEILSPTTDIACLANANDRHNNHSYVIRLHHAGRSVILGGDAETDVWDDILRHYGNGLSCDVLKASHHGRESGYHQDAVKAMNPLLTICSVGKKPSTDASFRYNRIKDNKVLSTRWAGDIRVIITPQGNITYDTQYEV